MMNDLSALSSVDIPVIYTVLDNTHNNNKNNLMSVKLYTHS